MMDASRTAILATLIAVAALAPGRNAQAQDRTAGLGKVVAAERAFAKLSLDTLTQVAFDRYLTADAIVFRPRAMRAAEARARAPLPRALVLTWEPEWADVSRAGDLGYTSGPWVSGTRGTDADPKFGRYLTIWRRQADGRYLAVLEAAIATPPEAESPEKTKYAAASAWTGKPDAAADRASLLRADNGFANISRQRGYAAAVKPIADPDIRLLRNLQSPAVKMDSIAIMQKDARVTWWVPTEASVSASGDLGYTRGTYILIMPDGKREAGDYARVWKRAADGTWRVALDLLGAGR